MRNLKVALLAACAVVVGWAFTASADIPASAYVQRGLIGLWDGIENAGAGTHDPNATTWVDLVSGAALTKSGTVTVESDGMVFDGSSYFTRGTNGPFPADSVFPWTAEVHFKVNSVRSGDNHVIGTNGSGGWSFLQTNGKNFAFVPRYGSSYQWAYDSKALAAGDEITASGISDTSTIALYKDGALAGSANVAGAHNNGASTVAFKIGTSGTSANGLNGKVFSARIYNRVLTEGEILYNANVDKIRFQGADGATLTWPDGFSFNDGRILAEVKVSFDETKGSVKANGVALGDGVAAWLATDAPLTLVATPAEGHWFIGWSGVTDGMDAKSPTLTVSACCPLNLTANFSAPTPVAPIDGISAKSYVQDGLLAMWDGIENVGYGYHSNTADTWKNLSEEGSVWDMQPFAFTRTDSVPVYTWNDDNCKISMNPNRDGGEQPRFFVNHADGSTKQIEVVAMTEREGTLIGTNPSGANWLLGTINGPFYVKMSASDGKKYAAMPTKAVCCQSAELHDGGILYRDGAAVSSSGTANVGVGLVQGTSIIGGSYRTPNANVYSTRFYSKTLSECERAVNWGVDQVRFKGVDYKTIFTNEVYADMKAVVVVGEPANIGISSIPYGVHSFAGSTNGTASISGAVVYEEDGVVAFPDVNDPENVRAFCTGWTLQVGDGVPTSGGNSSCNLGTVSRRALVTWRFEAQYRVHLSAPAGGRIKVGASEPTSAFDGWNGIGGELTLTAVADDGYRFSGWNGDTQGIDTQAATITVPNDGIRTIAARFVHAVKAPAPFGVTAKSYVQDGLLAMWDGIENVGAGYHSNEADFWRNLSDEGAVWDMAPNSQAVGYYNWSDNYLQVKSNPNFGSSAQGGAFAVNKTDTSTKQMEMAATQVNDGGMAATSPNGAAWVFGTFNSVFWIKQNYNTIYSVPSKAFHGFSLDMANYRPETTKWALYMDGAPAATLANEKSCGGLGVPSGETRVGNFYNASNSKVHNYRLYSKSLSEAERTLNWGVDQVRFNGADFKAIFAGDDYADVPAVVVLGNTYPNVYGVSSQGYGVNPFAGSFSGTVTLSGEREYEDGVTALPDAANPDRKRAVCTGYSLKLGDGEAITGEGTSVTVSETAGRVLVEWQFIEQFHLMATAGAGGKVKLGDGELSASVDTWAASGANVRLTAVADEGYVFQCWTGDIEGFDDRAAAVAVPNDRLRTLTAVFVKATRVVSQDGFTAKSYVRRGLVAQWDGKENVAYGAFDEKATSWRQLIGQSGHHDLYPNAAVRYSWVDDSLLVDDSATGAFFTNDATTVIGAVECNASLSANAVFWSSKDKSEPGYHLLGYANSYFYINSTGDGYDFSDLTHQHTYSADFTGARALYVDDEQRGTKGTCGLGATEGITQLGRVYSSGKPKVRSLRYYAEPLTANERRINYGIDQVRFHGQGVVETFGSPLYDDVPIIVVAGNPVCNGVSSVPYGITVYDGPSTNVGKVVLSGSRIYEDGRIGFPGAFDPERSRALYQGGRYRVGNSMWHDFALDCQECDIGTLTGRAVIEWRFGLAEVRTDIQAKEGGSVRFKDGSGLTDRWTPVNTELKVVAEPAAGYIFHHWEVEGQPLADNRKPEQSFVADGGRTLTAVFVRGQQLSWNSYVTNGLAAQYDAEFNAIDADGNPCHSSDALEWKQLVAGSPARDAKLENTTLAAAGITWTDKSLNFLGTGRFLIRGLNSDGGGSGWFADAYLRACDGIAGFGTEFCAFIVDLGPDRHGTQLATTANGNVYSMGVNYSTNDRGTEWGNSKVGDTGVPDKYFAGRGGVNWDISYAQHVRAACGSGTNVFYRNGLETSVSRGKINRVYSGTSYLNYFYLGSSNVNMYAFRVYTNTLDKYSIRWNSAVDRIRFLNGHPSDVTVSIGATALGTSVPAAGSETVLTLGDAFSATLTDAAMEVFDDGTRGYPLANSNLRLRCGWRLLMGGPEPTVTEGDGNVAAFTPSNVLAQLEWAFPTQRVFNVSIVGGVGGEVGVAGKAFHAENFAVWGDVNGTIDMVAVAPPNCQVRSWTVDGEQVKAARPRSVVRIPVPALGSPASSAEAVDLVVKFERIHGAYIILR